VKLCGRCLRRPPAFDKTIAAALYEAPFDQLVRGLKYGATLAYAPLFARLLHGRATHAVLADIDVVLPVPLSRARMATRGFNQAIEIARPFAEKLGRPLDTESVLRITDTAPQASLPFDARRRNVRGAFAVIDARRERIIGRRVGVVDDVMTTGATLEELAKTLKRAGAVAVVNLVVARTP
jgi:ComF family protein